MARSTEKADKAEARSNSNGNGVATIAPPTYTPQAVAAPPRDAAKESALNRAVQQIEKQFGKGTVMKGDGVAQEVETIPTGSLSLDIALGGG